MNRLSLGLVVLAWTITLAEPCAAQGQWVNVSTRWCGNSCSEGHDGAACLCEYNAGQSPYSPSSWNSCYGVPCCITSSLTVECSVGDPDCSCRLQDGTDPGSMRRWCFPSAPTVTCIAPGQTGNYSCSFNCEWEDSCTITAPLVAPNWISVNNRFGSQCTGENETGFWSWSAWRSFFGADTCNLGDQSPWDDFPLENPICD